MVEGLERALHILDNTPWRETHRVGVLYVASSQNTEEAILGNRGGSESYHQVESSGIFP